MTSFNIRKILVPVDFSEAGEKAINQAIYLAGMNNASITLLHIIDSPANTYGPDYLGASRSFKDEFETMLHNSVKEKMEALKNRIIKEGINDVEYFIEKGKVYKKIIQVANEIKTYIIMMGTHGVSGVKEFFAGSNTFRVVGKTNCPVLSFQQKAKKNGFSNILLPIQNKEHSREDVEYAVQIAKIYGAKIHLLAINTDPDKASLKKMQLMATQTQKIIEKRGIECTYDVLTSQFVANLILSFAENKKSDLLVIMSDLDRMGLSEYIIGPVAQQLVNHSPIPVMSIHPSYHPSVINQANPMTY